MELDIFKGRYRQQGADLKKAILLIITFLILASVLFFGRLEIIKNAEVKIGPLWAGVGTAKDSQYLTLLNSYKMAQNSYKEFNGSYSESESAIGYHISDSRIFLISSVASLPEKYKMRIKESELPHVDKNFYQVLLVVNDNSEEAVWLARSNAEPIKILPRLSGVEGDRGDQNP